MKNLLIFTLFFFSITISGCFDKEKNDSENNGESPRLNLSKSNYTLIQLEDVKSAEILKLLKSYDINSGDMLIALTPSGAKIFKFNNSSENLKSRSTEDKREVSKIFKYEFYSREYKKSENTVRFHNPNDDYCHSYKQRGIYKWIPAPPCPL